MTIAAAIVLLAFLTILAGLYFYLFFGWDDN